jgi:hypothetical protein
LVPNPLFIIQYVLAIGFVKSLNGLCILKNKFRLSSSWKRKVQAW